MEAQQFLSASYLDILFENRNKMYGAYELRQHDSRRTLIALVGTLLFIGACAIFFKLIPQTVPEITEFKIPVITTDLKPPPDLPSIPTPPTPPGVIQTSNNTTPLIVQRVPEDVKPPDLEIINSNETSIHITGNNIGAADLTGPIEPLGTGVVFDPAAKKEKEPKGFIPIEMEAQFPGGEKAWTNYISRALMKKIDEFSENDFGRCEIRFIVDVNGKVSDVTIINPRNNLLEEIARETIANGPKWIPAVQNGQSVKAYRIQPIIFNQAD